MSDEKPNTDFTSDFFLLDEFSYTVRGKSGKPDDVIKVSLDFDKIGLGFSCKLPSLFRLTDEPIVDESGKSTGMKNSAHILLEAITGQRAENTFPECVPSVRMFELAVRDIFQIPPHCGWRVVLGIFVAYLSELKYRNQAKKDSPDLPAS